MELKYPLDSEICVKFNNAMFDESNEVSACKLMGHGIEVSACKLMSHGIEVKHRVQFNFLISRTIRAKS